MYRPFPPVRPVRRLVLIPHMTSIQIQVWLQQTGSQAHLRWAVIWLMSEGFKPVEIAHRTGLSAVAVRSIVHRWNARGPDAVWDGRLGNCGRHKLTYRQWMELQLAFRD